MSDPNPDPNGPALWGSGPCSSLAEVRGHIDRIDAALIDLIAERLRYTRDAGRFKASIAQTGAPARVDDVIAKILARAASVGVPAEIAEPVWRSLITASIEDQKRLFLAEAPDHLKR